jgi:hypothetical protein
MERRDVFRILAATATAAAAAPLEAADRAPKFFSKEEYELLDKATEIILPADEEGGGAHDAGVPLYIDTVVSYADAPTKEMWKRCLTVLAGESDLSAALKKLTEGETAPRSEMETFFVRLKALTIESYFQSPIGYKYAGYRGDSHTFTFPGCTHPEHKKA